MIITKLPLEVWYKIIVEGYVDIEDVFNLSQTCKALSVILRDDYIWSGLFFREYGVILRDYEVLRNQAHDNSSKVSYHKKTLRFNAMHMELLTKLQDQDIESIESTIKFATRHLESNDYCSVLIKEEKNEYERIEKALTQPNSNIDLSNLSLLKNSIAGLNFKLGFEFLAEIILSAHSPYSVVDFEQFWLRISLFDKSYHKLVRHRQKKLTQINEDLNNKFYHREIVERQTVSMDYVENKIALHFRDIISLKVFLHKLIKFICSYFTVERRFFGFEYASQRLENFSLIRIYSNSTKGDQQVLYAIIAKIIQEFFIDRFLIHVSGNEVKLTAEITKTFLKIGGFLFLIQHNCVQQRSNYEVNMYNIQEISSHMRRVANASTRDIGKLVQPHELKDVLQYFLNLGDGFISDVSEERHSMEELRAMSVDDVYKLKHLGVNESYRLPRDFSNILKAKTHADLVNRYDNFVSNQMKNSPSTLSYMHNTSIYKVLESKFGELDNFRSITQLFDKYNSHSSLFMKNKLLKMTSTELASTAFSNLQVQKGNLPDLGSIVYDKRSQDVGIVLGNRENRAWQRAICEVLTKFGIQRSGTNNLQYFPPEENCAFRFIIHSFDLDIACYPVLKFYNKTLGGSIFTM